MKKLIFILTTGLLLSGLSHAKQQQWGNNVSFEMVISRDGQPKTTYKMWMKDSDIRMETIERDDQGNTRKAISLILNSKNIMYVYCPGENTAIKMKLDPTKIPIPASTGSAW